MSTFQPKQSELSIVNGVPLPEMPEDLFIPPQALEICLETFTGPMDLLLYLIKKQNINKISFLSLATENANEGFTFALSHIVSIFILDHGFDLSNARHAFDNLFLIKISEIISVTKNVIGYGRRPTDC